MLQATKKPMDTSANTTSTHSILLQQDEPGSHNQRNSANVLEHPIEGGSYGHSAAEYQQSIFLSQSQQLPAGFLDPTAMDLGPLVPIAPPEYAQMPWIEGQFSDFTGDTNYSRR